MPMMLFKLAMFEAWVLGVFLASFRTERALVFEAGSMELLLLGFAFLFALHTATLGLFRIETVRSRRVNGIAAVVMTLAFAAATALEPSRDGQISLFWALGPMTLSLILARIAYFMRRDWAEEAE